jgi:hypothetical protein
MRVRSHQHLQPAYGFGSEHWDQQRNRQDECGFAPTSADPLGPNRGRPRRSSARPRRYEPDDSSNPRLSIRRRVYRCDLRLDDPDGRVADVAIRVQHTRAEASPVVSRR